MQDVTMQYYTTYSFEDLKPCGVKLLAAAKASYNQTTTFIRGRPDAVRRKYTQTKYDNVALVAPCVALSP